MATGPWHILTLKPQIALRSRDQLIDDALVTTVPALPLRGVYEDGLYVDTCTRLAGLYFGSEDFVILSPGLQTNEYT